MSLLENYYHDDITEEQYELLEEIPKCAEYIGQRIDDGGEPTEESLAMWMADHFLGKPDEEGESDE